MTDNQTKMLELLGITEDDTLPKPSADEQIAELKAQNEMLTECILEMASIVYA